MAKSKADKMALVNKWGVKPGQIWELGGGYVNEGEEVWPAHYVACGPAEDLTIWRDLLVLAGRFSVDNILTSPPYADKRRGSYPGAIAPQDWPGWFAGQVAPAMRRILRSDGSFFINVRGHCKGRRLSYGKRAIILLEDTGWILYEDYIWIKPGYPGQARQRLKNAWEPIYQMTINTPPANTLDQLAEERPRDEDGRGFRPSYKNLPQTQGDPDAWGGVEPAAHKVYPSNVIHAAPDPLGVPGFGHPARFPRKIPRFFMTGWRGAHQYPLWADPFLGSGTSLIEAEAQGVGLIGTDLDPWAITLTLERYELEYNQTPTIVYDPPIPGGDK